MWAKIWKIYDEILNLSPSRVDMGGMGREEPLSKNERTDGRRNDFYRAHVLKTFSNK
jgi:hypothetical protein